MTSSELPEKHEYDEDNELKGLPRVIQTALKAHPTWKRIDRETVVCAGADCDWQKLGGGSINKRWLAHQTNVLLNVIGTWYYDI